MANDDSGKYESPARYLIAMIEALHSDLNNIREDMASERLTRGAAELANEKRITRLETKIAFYSGMGALLGGALVEAIARQLHL